MVRIHFDIALTSACVRDHRRMFTNARRTITTICDIEYVDSFGKSRREYPTARSLAIGERDHTDESTWLEPANNCGQRPRDQHFLQRTQRVSMAHVCARAPSCLSILTGGAADRPGDVRNRPRRTSSARAMPKCIKLHVNAYLLFKYYIRARSCSCLHHPCTTAHDAHRTYARARARARDARETPIE